MEERKIIKKRVKRITISKNQDVYDITTESNHNFFANGCLVHNCAEIFLRPKQFCNLTEVVVRPGDTLNTLQEKVKYATILGIMQSTLTKFNFLDVDWQKNCEEERLLGVSLSGIMDHNILSNEKKPERMEDWLNAMKETSINIAKKWSKALGINMPTAITAIKPSGCTLPETEIRTYDGDMSLKDIFEYGGVDLDQIPESADSAWIEPTENILVYDENNELKKITNFFVNGMAVVYDVEDENGQVWTFTGNHKLKTVNGWKRVDELTDNDDIISF